MEPAQRDYSGVSLDDYIKTNPEALNDIKVKASKLRFRPPSQQWRLGRNAIRPVKRLGRTGPLRPLVPYRGQTRTEDGLPKLVVKRYCSLHPASVFHRLGWNPLHVAARQKLYKARFFELRQRLNSRGRHKPWMFWVRRPYLPWYPAFNRHPAMLPQKHWGTVTTRQLVNLQRRENLQNKQIWPQNRQMYEEPPYNYQQPRQFHKAQPFNQQRIPGDSLSLSSEAAIKQYPIARDEFMPPLVDRNILPPSPVGSIVSTLSRTQTGRNPFAQRSVGQAVPFNNFPARPANQFSGQNPFASTSRGSVTNFGNVSLNSGFRPTPTTTNIPCTQRFMYMAVE